MYVHSANLTFTGLVRGDHLGFTQIPDIYRYSPEGVLLETAKNGGIFLLVPNN